MRLSTRTITPAAVVAACLFCVSIAEAKKPVKPPGGGGGGSDSATAPFTVIELPGIDIAYKVSQQSVEGLSPSLEAPEAMRLTRWSTLQRGWCWLMVRCRYRATLPATLGT